MNGKGVCVGDWEKSEGDDRAENRVSVGLNGERLQIGAWNTISAFSPRFPKNGLWGLAQ